MRGSMMTYMRSPIRFTTRPSSGEEEERAEDDRVVALEQRFEAEQPEAVEREDDLDQQNTGEEDADEGARQAGDDDQHRVAEDVAVEHAAFGQALGARGDDVVLADLIEERILRQHRRGGEAAHRHGQDRQRQVPEIVLDLAEQRELPEVAGDNSAQREPVEVAAAGEEHDQEDREDEIGDRVADDDDAAGPDVEALAVAHRLGDAERDRDQVGQQRGPEPERDRDRQLVEDQIDHAVVAEEAGAEVEAHILAHHVEEALQRWLVEAVFLLQPLDQGGVETAGAAVLAGGGALGDIELGPLADLAGACARDPRRGAHRRPGELRDRLLDRAARRDLDDREIDHHDREQRRDDQQQAANDVGEHGCRDARGATACPGSSLALCGRRERARPGPGRAAQASAPAPHAAPSR